MKIHSQLNIVIRGVVRELGTGGDKARIASTRKALRDSTYPLIDTRDLVFSPPVMSTCEVLFVFMKMA